MSTNCSIDLFIVGNYEDYFCIECPVVVLDYEEYENYRIYHLFELMRQEIDTYRDRRSL